MVDIPLLVAKDIPQIFSRFPCPLRQKGWPLQMKNVFCGSRERHVGVGEVSDISGVVLVSCSMETG